MPRHDTAHSPNAAESGPTRRGTVVEVMLSIIVLGALLMFALALPYLAGCLIG
ncbi:hypothetical protein [Bradyrhizobium sp. STM 3562]|uniref:hypothetical protein n=1 Tax=Bradyrhizobium sp. STM 3562 TaxID=578924 RepID=UPI00388F6CD1